MALLRGNVCRKLIGACNPIACLIHVLRYLNIGQDSGSSEGSHGPFHAPLDQFADDLAPVLKRVEESIGAKAEHVNLWLGAADITSPEGMRSQMHADPYDNIYFLLAGESEGWDDLI